MKTQEEDERKGGGVYDEVPEMSLEMPLKGFAYFLFGLSDIKGRLFSFCRQAYVWHMHLTCKCMQAASTHCTSEITSFSINALAKLGSQP